MTLPYGLLPQVGDPTQGPPPGGLLGAAMGAPTQLTPSAPPQGDATAQPGFIQRIIQSLMPTPSGTGAYLSPSDVTNARRNSIFQAAISLLRNSSARDPYHPAPGVGAAVGDALQAGQAGFTDSTNNALQRGQTATQIGANQQRMGLLKQYGTGAPNETPDQTAQRLGNLSSGLAALGFPQDAQAVDRQAWLLKALHQQEPDRYSAVPLGDGIGILDKKTGTIMPGPAVGSKPMSGDERARLEEAQARMKQMDEEHQNAANAHAVTLLDTKTKPLATQYANLQNLHSMIQLAQTDPAAMPALITAIAQVQGGAGGTRALGVIRKGAATFDLSLPGQAQQFFAQRGKGVLTQEEAANLTKAYAPALSQIRGQHDRALASVLKAFPKSKDVLSTSSEMYPDFQDSTPNAPFPASSAATAVPSIMGAANARR